MRKQVKALLLILFVCMCIHGVFITYVFKAVQRRSWVYPIKSAIFGQSMTTGATPSPPTAPIDVQVHLHTRAPGSSKSASASAPFVLREETIKYANFTIRHPRFASNRSRELFYKSQINVDFLQPPTIDKLTGKIYHVSNGTYSLPHDCGYLSKLDHVLKNRSASYTWKHCLIPLLIPGGNSFQHFIDGVLPKIIQILSILKAHPRCQIIIWRARDNTVYDMLGALNISMDQVLLTSQLSGGFVADNLIYTCNTPPLHPYLWTEARRLLGAVTQLKVPLRKAYVIIITRSGCFNCGRMVLNQDEIVQKLQKRYGTEIVKIFKGPYTYNETLTLFGRARIILSPHGGGLYNILYAPKGTVVVEFMPTTSSGEMIAASKKIFMAQASLLGQEYWRMALPSVHKGDMNVDMAELGHILDTVDKRHGVLINTTKTSSTA